MLRHLPVVNGGFCGDGGRQTTDYRIASELIAAARQRGGDRRL